MWDTTFCGEALEFPWNDGRVGQNFNGSHFESCKICQCPVWMQLHVSRWWRNSHVCISVRKGLQMVYGCVAWVCIAGINSKGSWDNIRRRNPDIWDAPSTSTASLYTPDFQWFSWTLYAVISVELCRIWLDPTGEAVGTGWRPQRWWRLWLIRVINAINWW